MTTDAKPSNLFRVLKAGPVVKESPCGSDNLLEHYGLSGIYKIFSNQAPDAYLKGVPVSVDFRRGKESMELAPLAMLNPMNVSISAFTAYQLMPFKLQPGSMPAGLLSKEDLGQQVDVDALRVKGKLIADPPPGSKPKKDKKDKDKKHKKDKKGSNKRKASEEPSDGTTAVTGLPSTGTSSGAVRLRIKQPRLGS